MKRWVIFILPYLLVHLHAGKVLLLVIASDDLPVYTELQKVWRQYMHSDRENFECYFIKAGHRTRAKFRFEGDTLWLKTTETLVPGTLVKTVYAMDAFKDRLNEFDYVYRTNLSSFIIFPKLLDFLRTLPQERCYAGKIDCSGNNELCWACGTGIILSRDLVNMVIQKEGEMLRLVNTLRFNDDVIFGKFFQKYQIPLLPAPRTDFYTLTSWLDKREDLPADAFCIRVKSASHLRYKHDICIHKELLEKYYKSF